MSDVVRIAVGLPSFAPSAPDSWDHLVDHAHLLERCGVDRVLVSEHVVFGPDLDSYSDPAAGGRAGGRQPTGPDGHWLEPLTTLTFVAAHTRQIRLGTNILLAALRPAAVLAKTAATLDVLSRGRLDLGVGVGWQRAEYESVGVTFSERGRLLDRTLEVCQRLWRESEVSFTSPELNFERIHQMPKPVQPGGVPIWVSGTVNPAVARRLARFGSGWIPWGADADNIDRAIASMRAAVQKVGGDPDGFGVAGGIRLIRRPDASPDVGAMADRITQLARLGVTDVQLTHWPFSEDSLGDLVGEVHAQVCD
ncbi:TIGR03619 family F420-dependent LLM class oxidoreductase [Mycolicibacterium gadium]|uniref:TIGR03619 family F420-dependent LLM class oxidoreductase n=1 Tax=Mycolicibacterium gadium TaxID=1794 RepID=UPI002FDE8480